MKNTAGFTLIEILIAVVIIAILAAIAIPSYEKFVKKAKRGEVKVELDQIAKDIKARAMVNSRYAGIDLADVNASSSFPSTGTATYNLTLNPSPLTGSTYTITATPVSGGRMSGDGSLIINQLGQTCWTKKGCSAPDANSSWAD